MKHLHPLALILLFHFVPTGAGSFAAPPPNIVFVLADDVRWDDLGCTGHPFSQTPNIDRLAREGVLFRNAFATTPLCSPSRASFLTGLYPHTHGITDNTDRSEASHKLVTFPQMLQRAGCETAFIGKWHMGNDDSHRPGFDHWACLQGQGSSFNASMNINGTTVKTTGHVTDALTEQVLDFLKQPHTKPFLLWFAHKAVHPETVQRADGSLSDPNAATFIPAKRHERLYAGAKVPRRPNVVAPQNQPALQREVSGLPPLGPGTGSTDESILGRLRMLAGIDDSTGELLRALEASGQLDNTIFVFTSDHGYFYGEHGLSVERRLAYEEGIRIPLLVRYPPIVKPRSVRDQLVLSIDLAPTLLELAGAPAPTGLHGRSLVALLQNDGPGIRSSFLIEHFSDTVFPRASKMGHQTVRTERWKLIRYVDLDGMDELYDLRDDPYELNNLIGSSNAAGDEQRMRAELAHLLKNTGAPARP